MNLENLVSKEDEIHTQQDTENKHLLEQLEAVKNKKQTQENAAADKIRRLDSQLKNVKLELSGIKSKNEATAASEEKKIENLLQHQEKVEQDLNDVKKLKNEVGNSAEKDMKKIQEKHDVNTEKNIELLEAINRSVKEIKVELEKRSRGEAIGNAREITARIDIGDHYFIFLGYHNYNKYKITKLSTNIG